MYGYRIYNSNLYLATRWEEKQLRLVEDGTALDRDREYINGG